MIEKLYKVINKEKTTYLPASVINGPDGMLRKNLKLLSQELDECDRDEIIATMWDYLTELDLEVGDKVLATLQFRVCHLPDGTSHQHVDVVDIRKVTEFE